MTKTITVKDVKIGGQNPVVVQSMCNTKTRDIESTLRQIGELSERGCKIVRLAVFNQEDADGLPVIVMASPVPIVADIHFDYRLAVKAALAGVAKIRINPGNIGNDEHVKKVVDVCKERNIPIRIGVNGGSLQKDILEKYQAPTAEALVESALRHVEILHRFDYDDIAISIKSSDVQTTIEGYRLLSQTCDYPLHLGVTEAGTYKMGLLKSAIGIGSLLCDGIGDTIRVSLTDDPVKEVEAGYDILKACGIEKNYVQVISCPTCGRCRIDVISIAKEVEAALSGVHVPLKVAVMGCAVNGPGEAREADIGIAGGDGDALLFKKGEIIGKVRGDIAAGLLSEVEKLLNQGV